MDNSTTEQEITGTDLLIYLCGLAKLVLLFFSKRESESRQPMAGEVFNNNAISEKGGPSHTVGGNESWCTHSGKQ